VEAREERTAFFLQYGRTTMRKSNWLGWQNNCGWNRSAADGK
jgi:hypothetical protein